MGDFNHGHIQWKSLESIGGEDQQFLFLILCYTLENEFFQFTMVL